ncbi:hypothetical protein CBS63078_875 [Aspergillus niger]|nr:hypothetical protein CBS115989_4503 [Aspergillus niger]KAI2832174.1 hypothetical protein CBS133816_1658 [Aspergillus niger]KAI2843381.1 hypothetical protein CBS11350_5250 [Aspergillus niger]KAI2855177.1 hypothetical protein CBS11232_4497 [Aspergillus niger]KAI2867150.1 hypothetical protein CBS12448_588 [Aspergillus niger]
MRFTSFAIATAFLATMVSATPVAEPEPNPVELAARAKYTIHCSGGQNPDSHCLTPHSKCDSYGTPSILEKYEQKPDIGRRMKNDKGD